MEKEYSEVGYPYIKLNFYYFQREKQQNFEIKKITKKEIFSKFTEKKREKRRIKDQKKKLKRENFKNDGESNENKDNETDVNIELNQGINGQLKDCKDNNENNESLNTDNKIEKIDFNVPMLKPVEKRKEEVRKVMVIDYDF